MVTDRSYLSLDRQRNHNQRLLLILLCAAGVVAYGVTGWAALSLLLVVLGGWLLVAPPRVAIWGWATLPLGLLLGLMVAGFFLDGGRADWQQEARMLGIAIGAGSNPQPLHSVAMLPWLLAGALWFTLCVRYAPASAEQRWLALRLLAGALVLLAIGVIVGNVSGWRLPWAEQVAVFSWFPNRNQTGSLLAAGSVLAAGLALYQLGKSGWRCGAWTVLALLVLTAALQTGSRGAAINFVCGMALLAGGWIVRLRGQLWLKATVSIILFALCVFIVFGGTARDRLIDWLALSPVDVYQNDMRMQLYRDTVPAIGDQWLFGYGVGQFSAVFPQYRVESKGELTFLHPESDWLWWGFELGGVGLLLLVSILTVCGYRLLPLGGSGHDQDDAALRWCALSALTVLLAHSVTDVGWHRMAFVMLGMLLYTLALPRRQPCPVGKMTIVGWRLCGVVALGCAALPAILQWTGASLTTAVAREASEPSRYFPLLREPYLRRAVLRADTDLAAALVDFRRARFVDPVSVSVPLWEGQFLLAYSDAHAELAFTEALRRSPESARVYRDIVRSVGDQEEWTDRLHRLAGSDSERLGVFWSRKKTIAALAQGEVHPDLMTDWRLLSLAVKRELLQYLLRHSQHPATRSLLEISNAQDRTQLWESEFYLLCEDAQWQQAANFFLLHATDLPQQPKEQVSAVDLQRRTAAYLATADGQDPLAAQRLLEGWIGRQDWGEVQKLADRLSQRKDILPVVRYWQGYSYWMQDDFQQACQAWAAYLQTVSKRK